MTVMRFAALVLATLLAGCGAVKAVSDPAKPHHTQDGFRNNYSTTVQRPFSALLRWQWERLRADSPPGPPAATPTVQADLAFIVRNAQAGAQMAPALTWIGHASMLVQANGLNVLTDPVFAERASPFGFVGPKRHQPPGVALKDLPHIDVVLISHNHYDHLDRQGVIDLSKQAGGSPLFLVPLGLKAWMADAGIDNAVELDWWDTHTLRGVDFAFTPVQHWTSRTPFDRSKTLWGGWAVFGTDLQWYFSGDTGYSQDFVDTRAHFESRQTPALGGGFDVALIAVGAYEPRWFMKGQHVNPEEAVRIHQDLGAKRSVGVHWGTFSLTDEPLDQPPKDLAAARQAQGLRDEDFIVMAVGATQAIAKRSVPR
jgi:N-acyl-phosphatidylethanolamine-hydrolysing phospholipase D